MERGAVAVYDMGEIFLARRISTTLLDGMKPFFSQLRGRESNTGRH